MLSFAQYLLEYPMSYYEALPNIDPPKDVAAAQKRFGLTNIKWKQIDNKSVHSSGEYEDGIIAMKPGDTKENFMHELGHELFDASHKEKIRPLLTRIRDKYRVHMGDYDKADRSPYKNIELGGHWYTYSHSGPQFEFDELFAITFSFVMTGNSFDDAQIEKDYDTMLDTLAAVKG
jgi:hypothetical protein